MAKNCALTLPSKPFELLPLLPGPLQSLATWLTGWQKKVLIVGYHLQWGWLVEVQSSSGARLVRDPLRRIKGGYRAATQAPRYPSTPRHKADQPPITPPSTQKVPWREGTVDRGNRVRKVVFSWDWMKQQLVAFFKAKSIIENLQQSSSFTKVL